MFEKFLADNNITEKKICVGVSGGSDSLALVLMAHQELFSLGYKVIALTVNHGLRETSQKEAEYVASIMQQFGIEHHILYWQGSKPITGIEEAARNARYGLIEDWCREQGIKVLMTAHHLYDQVETFFMRLERGSGLDGLCGMRDVFKRGNILVVRPLLYISPKVMKDYLLKKNIKWIEDESNFCTELLRVRIRQFLPEFEQKTGIDVVKIAKAMRCLQSSQNYIEKEVEKVLKNIFRTYEQKAFWCNYAEFLRLDKEIKFRVLGKIFKAISGADYIPQADKIFSLIEKIQTTSFKASTLGYCYICYFDNKLWISPEKVYNESYSQKAWRDYISKNVKLKNKKLPSRIKRLMLK